MTPEFGWRVLAFLMNHLWQSTLVAGVACLVCRILLQANSPRVRFAVWTAASVKFLVPFAAIVEIGRWLGARQLISRAQSLEVFTLVSGGGRAWAAAPFHATDAKAAGSVSWEWVPLALITIWAAGGLFVALRWLRGWWMVRRAAADAIALRTFRGIPVLSSQRMAEDRIEPGVFGIFRPVILLPGGIEERLSAPQLEAILMHEWRHTRRRDNLLAAIQMLAETAFWFFPAVRLLGEQLLEERELACDQAVLDEANAEDYVAGILNVCRLYCESELACVSGITGADLRERVRMLLNHERPQPLGTFRRWALSVGVAGIATGPLAMGLLTAPAVVAQTASSFVGMQTSADKKFEVATVKLSPLDAQGGRLGPPGRGSISIVNLPLRGIIIQSFRSQRSMVFGGPDWINTERYDIVGKGPDPSMTNPEVWEMMRSLLIERFHLKFHVEERELPVFALTIAKGGHKLKAGEEGRCAEEIKQARNCGDILVLPYGRGIYNMPIGALITGIAGLAPRPIIDHTGLNGKYDINVTWLPDGVTMADLADVPPEARPAEMGMFEALEKQAGLKLEATKAPMPVLIIDSIDRPSGN